MWEIIRPKIVQQHANGKPQPLTILLVVQVLQHTITHLTHPIHFHIPTHSHQPAINTVSPLYMCKHQPSTLTLHISNQTYTKLLPHHLHKITKTLTIIQTNNKCTHHQHNHLIHSFCNHSLPHFAHHNVVPSLLSRVQLCCIQYRMCSYSLISRANYRLVSHV